MKFKILATSDLHGMLPEIHEEFDILFVCGDICPTHSQFPAFQEEWIKVDFVEWVNSLPGSGWVVATWGNHDVIGERFGESDLRELKRLTHGRLCMLSDSEVTLELSDLETGEIRGLRIYGTPICKPFGTWAFMRENLAEEYSKIPEGLDVLISHDSADLGELGIIHEGRYAGENAGNLELAERIKETQPKYYFCGHIHSGDHELRERSGVMSANVSRTNEWYEPVNELLKLEI